jgi:hypothetical protein
MRRGRAPRSATNRLLALLDRRPGRRRGAPRGARLLRAHPAMAAGPGEVDRVGARVALRRAGPAARRTGQGSPGRHLRPGGRPEPPGHTGGLTWAWFWQPRAMARPHAPPSVTAVPPDRRFVFTRGNSARRHRIRVGDRVPARRSPRPGVLLGRDRALCTAMSDVSPRLIVAAWPSPDDGFEVQVDAEESVRRPYGVATGWRGRLGRHSFRGRMFPAGRHGRGIRRPGAVCRRPMTAVATDRLCTASAGTVELRHPRRSPVPPPPRSRADPGDRGGPLPRQ